MDYEQLILQEFFVEGKAREKSHVLLHITEPTTPQEKKVGYFFALAEIEGGTIEQIEHIQTMIDDLESGVYETAATEHKTSFEITLEYINRRGHHLLGFDGSSHIIVGTICDGDISFAYHGDASAQLIYQTPEGTHAGIDILAGESPKPDQLFSAVLEGQMNPGDYFFVATPHVMPLVADRLTQMLPAAPPKQAAATIDTFARSTNGELSYGGIIATIVTDEASVEEPEEIAGAAASLEHLSNVRTETRNTASSIPLPKRSKAKRKNAGRRTAGDDTDVPLGNQMLVLLGRGIVVVLKFFIAILLRILVFIKDIVVNGFILATNIGGQRQYVLDNVRRWIDNKKDAYARLPIMSKVLFFATIAVALVFVGSILYLRAREAKEAELAAYVNTVQAIMDKRDAAESSLIYGDSERAFTLLDEARNMIAELPEKNDDETARKQKLTQDIETLLVDLRNVTVVTPEVFATLNTAEATSMVRIDDSIIVYGPDDTSHYVVNMNTGQTEQRDHSTIPTLLSADAPKEYDYVSFLTGPTDIATLDPESFTISEATIGSPVETTLVDLAIYNRRAYTLSPSSNQIYRHSPTQNGFDGGSAWLDADVDLSNANAIAIDGDIFVLKSTGELLKFFDGEPQPFNITGVDPVITAPTDMWTYNDVEYIYILEPSENRLVALNKDGSLSEQFTAENWNEPEAFVVNEETNEVYVLDENVVYRFSTR